MFQKPEGCHDQIDPSPREGALIVEQYYRPDPRCMQGGLTFVMIYTIIVRAF